MPTSKRGEGIIMANRHIALVTRYFQLIESFSLDESEFSTILHPDFRQREFPNQLNKTGQESNREEIIKRAALGRTMLSAQKFDITNFFESGDQMVVESAWSGTMARDAGPLKKGQELKAHFCIVLEFREGKLYRQRSYDCFEPF